MEGTRQEIADRYRVSLGMVKKLLQQTGSPEAKPMTHGYEVVYAQFSPDARLLATIAKHWTSPNYMSQVIRLWDVSTGNLSVIRFHWIATAATKVTVAEFAAVAGGLELNKAGGFDIIEPLPSKLEAVAMELRNYVNFPKSSAPNGR